MNASAFGGVGERTNLLYRFGEERGKSECEYTYICVSLQTPPEFLALKRKMLVLRGHNKRAKISSSRALGKIPSFSFEFL